MQQVPAVELPFGYFLTAPFFGVLAGVFLAFSGAEPWMTRWAAPTLAATHFLLLGCMVMVMMGALVQVLPVVSSAQVPAALRLGPWVRVGLGTGTLALGTALAGGPHWLFHVAGASLVLAFASYLVPLTAVLVRRIRGGDAVFAIRIAVLCLWITVCLGVLLVVGHIAPASFPTYRTWTTTHASFGLVGWMSILIMAVGFPVLPMFYVAPDYPLVLTRGLPIVLVAGLLLQDVWSVGLCLLTYCVATLLVLARRKRRAPDLTIRFWQLGLIALACSVFIAWFGVASELMVGVLFVVGFGLSVMLGMLHKIVPFLAFMHLQRARMKHPSRVGELPSMAAVIPKRRTRDQLRVHVFCIASCVVAVLWPALGPIAGAALALDAALLLLSVWQGERYYRRLLQAWT